MAHCDIDLDEHRLARVSAGAQLLLEVAVMLDRPHWYRRKRMTSMLDGCTPWPEEFVDRYWAAGHWRGDTLDTLLRGWALQYGPRSWAATSASRTRR
ncbi:hypothetical protein [Streptomyces sp. H27-C3]|uniref:hypothetical protein n=1 Tax=Streptomyces sp. H27-C3 TaxID=3046305 RepID=UPI0024B87F3C|nr:hypothetical protein [Streptomyces sp. H27-C3]MDJ0466921.1 hypothetical protein [Streptomyces sp. H27-C3]